jgi:hypothetical protein
MYVNQHAFKHVHVLIYINVLIFLTENYVSFSIICVLDGF